MTTSPPTANSFSPADNATGVAVNTDVVIDFSKNVQKGAGNIVIKKSSDDSTTHTISVDQVNISGNTVTITSPKFDSTTSYYVQIDSGAFEDLSANDYAGISDKTTWNFTTKDIIAPTVDSFSPADHATGVAVNTDLIIDFNENVQKGAGNIVIKKSSDDSTIHAIPVTSDQVTISGNTVTINPSPNFARDTDYYVQIAAGVIEDLTDNNYAGISDKTTWNFRTTPVTPQPVRPGQPYMQDFSSGKPTAAQGWEYYSDNEGRIEVVGGRLRADDQTGNDTYSLNEAILHLDLAGQSNVQLRLDHWVLSDEEDSLPSTFIGHADGDGGAMSADGTTWYSLQQDFSTSGTITVDLDDAIDRAGIEYTPDFQIKFQQYDNYPEPSDGRELDNLAVIVVDTTAPTVDSFSPADESKILFSSDFSSDPGLVTNSTSRYFIGSGMFDNYTYTNSQQYGTFDVNYSGGDFNLVFDITILDRTSGDTNIGLFSSSRKTNQSGTGDPTIYVVYGGYENGVGFQGYDANRNSFESGGLLGSLSLNTIYHNVFTYDASTKTATLKVSSPTNSNFFNKSVVVPGGLSALPHFGVSSVGSWVTSNRRQHSQIDFVSLSGDVQDATGVAVNTDLVINFSENVQAGSGNIVIKKSSDDSIEQTIAVTSTQVTISGGTVTIVPSPNFARDTDYYVQIAAGVIEDGAGNSYAGISDKTTWNFRTVPATPQPVRPGQPYTQDFSSGKPTAAQGWEYYSDNEGRIEVVNGRLRGDDQTGNDTYSLNEAILHLDLTGQSNVQLRLDHWVLSDEEDSLPSTFTGHHNGDGGAMSADGTTWYSLQQDFSTSGTITVDLDDAIERAGIEYTSDFWIKIQQFDNYPEPDDGRELDNVYVEILNHAPTGSVTISGTALEGQTLTASNNLADADGLGTISYQWNRDNDINAWGSSDWGGSGAPTDSGYTEIFSTNHAFAALKSDGSITAWGDSSAGGSGAPTDSGYTEIFSTYGAFAALKSDGSITAWGDPDFGSSGARPTAAIRRSSRRALPSRQ